MDEAYAADPKVLARYEGLVWSTADRHVGKVNIERDDLEQVFRIKVWRALLSYDPSRSRMTEEAYVFSCVYNQAKDLYAGTQYNLRPESYIEDVAPSRDSGGTERTARDRFDDRYLSVDHDTVFGEVEEEEVSIPNTLSRAEVEVICLLYADYTQAAIARRCGYSKRDMEKVMELIRTKMADFKPGADAAQVVSLPVPHASQRELAAAA